ncbi:MAG TPA: VOC family protein [Acidimicrobiales bacterium]
MPAVLTNGFNHVAVLTADSERLHAFYEEVFEATVARDGPEPGATAAVRLSIVRLGPSSELNVFEIEGNHEAERQTPMFGRGRIDHLALQADSLEAFETIRDRLMARGATDGFVTDFGPALSVFFRDPDGLECEVCIDNPDARPGVANPPGTPSPRYQVGVPSHAR